MAMLRRIYVAVALIVVAVGITGCNDGAGSKQNGQPSGEQKIGKGKDKSRTMPAPPPIQKVD